MELSVRYTGVPIGTITVAALTGLAHGVLAPGAGYDLARARVDDAGQLLAPNGPVAPLLASTLADFRTWSRTASPEAMSWKIFAACP